MPDGATAARQVTWARVLAWLRPRRADTCAVAGVLAIVLYAAREALFLGRPFYLRDLHLQWYGQIETAVHALAAGEWPLWDPLVAFGRPLLANANNELLYPFTWLNLVVRPERYFTLFFTVHVALAGLGVYALARRYGASAAAAFLGAGAFTASGPLLSLGNLWNHLAAAAWLPWTLWAFERFADAPGRRRLVFWALLLAAQVLAGSPDVFVMTLLLVAAGVAARACAARARVVQSWRLAGAFTLALLLGLGLSAAQLLPSLELALRAGRAHASPEARAYWSLPPMLLAQTLVPVFSEDPTLDDNARRSLFEGREPLLLSLYLGAAALTLVLAAFLPRTSGAVSRPALRPFLALALGSALMFALGAHGPLYAPATAALPPLRLLRYPSKAMLVAALAASLLVALGAESWLRSAAGRARWICQVVLPLVALAGTALGLRATAPVGVPFAGAAPALAHLAILASAAACAVGLTALRPCVAPITLALVGTLAVLDPLWLHRDLNSTAPTAFYAFRPEFLPLLRGDGGMRTYVVDYSAEPDRSARLLGRRIPYLVAAPPTPHWRWRAALGMRAYPVPPVLAGFGVAEGYSRDSLGLHSPGVSWLHALLLRAEGTSLHARLLRLGAVSHVVSLHTRGFEDLHRVASVPGPFFEPIHVFAVPAPLPRAYVVEHARSVSDAEAVALLAASTFDVAREVLLAGDATAASRASASSAPSNDTRAAGHARVVSDRANRVRIEATMARAGWLVLADTYDPGWSVTVDGRDARLERANLAFRAVALVPGRHNVEFSYWPRWFGAGLLLSALAAGAALAACLTDARRPSERSLR